MSRLSDPAGFWRSTRKVLVSGSSLALMAAALASPSAATSPSARAAASVSTRAVSHGATAVSRGKLHLAGHSSPARAATSSTGPRQARPTLPVLRPRLAARSRLTHRAPAALGHRLAASSSARLLQSFDGIDAIDNLAAAGFDLEPPDEGLGAGAGWVVNFVNVVGAVYTHDGRQVGQPFYLNPFFKEAPEAFTSDPRVFYDARSRRWFATMVEVDFNADFSAVTGSRVDLAVSSSANPNGSWNVYRIPTSNRTHASCPCLADYPILGVDRGNVYITTAEFTSKLDSYNGAQLYAVSKRQLVAGRRSPNVVSFENLSVGGALAGHVQPANSYGAAPAEFLLSTLDPNGTFDHRLAVWALTNRRSVTSGRGMPALDVRIIDTEGYSFPPKAQTPPGLCTGDLCRGGGSPTTGIVDTDFDEMQEVQYINGRLVGALNTGITVAGDTTERSGVAWFVIRPHVTGAAVDNRTHVARQGYLSMNGQYLLYPHINMTRDGAMAVVFGLGGPGTYLSSAYAVAAPHHSFRRIHLAAPGTGPDNGVTGTNAFGGVGRWGDYSNGQIIPGTRRVWLATQYIPNTGTGNANWGNSIFELRLP